MRIVVNNANMKMKLNTKNAKFINCLKSKVNLANIAQKAAEMRRFDSAISFDVESVELKDREWTGRKFERVLEVWIYSIYGEGNRFCVCEHLG